MPDLNGPGPDPSEKRPFIREKIARPPMTRRQLMKRMAAFVFIAALGGGAAGASFAVMRPLAEKYLVEKPTEGSIPVTIPKDDPESLAGEVSTSPGESLSSQADPGGAETESESVPEGVTDGSEETPETEILETETPEEETEEETQEETEPVEDIVESVLEKWEYSVRDLETLYGSLRALVREADKGIVEVHSLKQETDWFDNPVETAGLYAGAVIAVTEQELLILTPEDAVENADSIKVTFEDGTEADGAIKGADGISGLAIVSVDMGQLKESTLTAVTVLKLGNSYSVKQGDLVAALGAPAGIVHSSAYGSVSYVARNVQVADGASRLLYADIRSDARSGTFLVNMAGEVIGWVTDLYAEEDRPDVTVAMAISDYKSVLEKMSNGYAPPYMGIYGQEVSSSMAEQGIPQGVYVTECVPDGPAYNAGIQNGDIIVRVNDKEIVTIKDYQNLVETLNQGTAVTVVVQRKAIEEYKELEYQVTVGAR